MLTAREIGFTPATKKTKFTIVVLQRQCVSSIATVPSKRYCAQVEDAFKELDANETCIFQRE